MASRGDMIKRARERVDARRDALGPYKDRPTARDRAIKRYSTTPITSDSFRDRRYNQQGGPRWDQKLGKKIKNFVGKAGEGIMGPYHAMAKAGKELFLDPARKAAENRRIMGELYEDEDSRERIKKSLMSDSDREFYEKYTRLADLFPDKKDYYLKEAETALRNAQISSRLNYGLGQLGYDTIGKEGFASYQPDFTGGEGTGFAEGSSPRFNLENFLGGLRGTKAGKDFYNAALAAQANEPGDTMMSNAMKSFGSPRGTFLDQREYNRMDLDDQMNVSEQNLMPTYDYDVYGDPMDNILYGEPGSGTGSLLLQSMYPGYSYYSDLDSAQKYGLEDMNERELMEFGYKNPPLSNIFGFNPNYEFE